MNTIGVIGVVIAIGTVLAAFGALYNTWWMAKKLDRQESEIKDIITISNYLFEINRQQMEALKSEINELKNNQKHG